MNNFHRRSIVAAGLLLFLSVTRIESFSPHASSSVSLSLSTTRLLSSTGMEVTLKRRIPTTITSRTAKTTITKTTINDDDDDNVIKELQGTTYRSGLVTVAGITLLFASNSPALHAAYVDVTQTPPVLLLNAATSSIALAGVLLGGPLLSSKSPVTEKSETTLTFSDGQSLSQSLSFLQWTDNIPLRAGLELGLWKFLGTTANMYGLSQTSADHGAFLIQLTTLLVPLAQGIMGVPIPPRIWSAIALALAGVILFTQDPSAGSSTSLQGDAMCALAAVFYATYDLRLFEWGKRVAPLELIRTKIATQTALSIGCLLALGGLGSAMDFVSTASTHDLMLVGGVALWSGLAVNLVAPYLQVGGQQAVGPARAQIVYASQPLWAAMMSMVVLGETVGDQGMLGGAAFLGAMLVAATAEAPNPDCPVKNCEV